MRKKLVLAIALLALIVWFGRVTNVGASTAFLVQDHGFAMGVSGTRNGNLILLNRTSTFTQDDPEIYAFVQATFYSANITWKWYEPSGQLYQSMSRSVDCVASPCEEFSSLWVQGTTVATTPGVWRLDLLADGQLIYSDYFRLVTVITEYDYWNFTVVKSFPPQINGSLRVVIHPSNVTWRYYQVYMPYAANVTAYDYSTGQHLQVTMSSGNPFVVDFGRSRPAGYSFVLKFNVPYQLADLGGGAYALVWREYPWERVGDIHPIPESFTVQLPRNVTLLDVAGYNSLDLVYNATDEPHLSLGLAAEPTHSPVGWTILYRDLSSVSNVRQPSQELNSAISLPVLPLTLSNLSVWAAVMSVFLLTASELASPIYSRSGYGILINRKHLRLAAILLVVIFMVAVTYQLTHQAVIQH